MGQEVKCIIWDCDGCLIDSELLACEAAARFISQAGFQVSTPEYIERFAGTGIKTILAYVEQQLGRPVMDVFSYERYTTERDQLFTEKLKAIPGVHQALDALDFPMCVASGSDMDRLRHTLQLAKLYDRFEGRIYCVDMVARGKPAPDVFLYAARQMGFAPEACLVIEDSINGVKAAQAAGMRCFGFCGGSHMTEAIVEVLRGLGLQTLFRDMRELPKLVALEAQCAA